MVQIGSKQKKIKNKKQRSAATSSAKDSASIVSEEPPPVVWRRKTPPPRRPFPMRDQGVLGLHPEKNQTTNPNHLPAANLQLPGDGVGALEWCIR